MTTYILERLRKLNELNANPAWYNRDIYRLLCRKEMLIVAYERVKSKTGNMTAGTDGTTLDGFSEVKVENLIKELRNENYQPKPVRKTYLPKKNGEMRPLGIPSVKDKIVQEAIRIILESIYDSNQGATFLENSHGFRPNRGTHTALKAVTSWNGVAWFIEGDIKSFFDNIDHHVLIHLLRKRIQDERFIRLIWKFLRAGIFDNNQHFKSIRGTPQGGIISPILANIYLHEFDVEVKGWVKLYTKGKRRKSNPIYRSLVRKRQCLLEQSKGARTKEVRALESQIEKTPSVDVNDPDFIRVRYVRYVDDWLIGVTGPYSLAVELRNKASKFLSSQLKLTLSSEKTVITSAFKDRANFLGMRIGNPNYKSVKVNTIHTEGKRTHRRRVNNNALIRLEAPKDKLIKRLAEEGFCDRNGNPTSKTSLINNDPDDIVGHFNRVKRGLFNYYKPVNNKDVMNYIDYILRMSLAKTLANKFKTSVAKQFQKRGKYLKVKKTLRDGSTKEVSYWDATFASVAGGFMVNNPNPTAPNRGRLYGQLSLNRN
jgi:group II intron reverse transcriptase/maturase